MRVCADQCRFRSLQHGGYDPLLDYFDDILRCHEVTNYSITLEYAVYIINFMCFVFNIKTYLMVLHNYVIVIAQGQGFMTRVQRQSLRTWAVYVAMEYCSTHKGTRYDGMIAGMK